MKVCRVGSMNYSHIQCTGHPRSGTHYITGLISINFMNGSDYLKIYRNHESPNIVTDPDTAYLHIWRDFQGVAESVYALKERFGLDVESHEAFLRRRYSDMWCMENSRAVMTNVRTLKGQARYPGVSDFFKPFSMTPHEFWMYYNEMWWNVTKKHPNVISVKYDDILMDFERTMAFISDRLGVKTSQFKNIEKKIGWWK